MQTKREEFLAPIVVSNAHVQTTMLKMVGPDHLVSSMVEKVENINVGNGFGMVIRCAVEELPVYTSPEDTYITVYQLLAHRCNI